MPHSRKREKGLTLVEVIVAVAIFVVAISWTMISVNQGLQLVKAMQEHRPDIGALAGKTLLDEPAPDGELESGLTIPVDEDFGGNGGGDLALYPDALWERELFPLDETNGLYQASILVNLLNRDGSETDYEIRFLMFRPDLAEAEASGNSDSVGGN